MSEEQADETLKEAEAPIGPEQEPTPEDLAEPTPELTEKLEAEREVTEKTEAMAEAEGYPAITADGKAVRIVEKRPTGHGVILVDADGNEYTADAASGQLQAA